MVTLSWPALGHHCNNFHDSFMMCKAVQMQNMLARVKGRHTVYTRRCRMLSAMHVHDVAMESLEVQ
jgi:hypothetical protein